MAETASGTVDTTADRPAGMLDRIGLDGGSRSALVADLGGLAELAAAATGTPWAYVLAAIVEGDGDGGEGDAEVLAATAGSDAAGFSRLVTSVVGAGGDRWKPVEVAAVATDRRDATGDGAGSVRSLAFVPVAIDDVQLGVAVCGSTPGEFGSEALAALRTVAAQVGSRYELAVADHRRRAEIQRLGNDHARLRAAIDAASTAVVERNLDRGTAWASGRFDTELREPSAFAEGWPSDAGVHPDELEELAAEAERWARESRVGDSAEFTYRLAGPDGAYRHIRSRSLVVERDGERIRVGTESDVTEDRHREEALAEQNWRLRQALAGLEDFMRLSEEGIRRPIAEVRSALRFVIDFQADELGSAVEDLEALDERIGELVSVVEELQELGRPPAADEVETVDLGGSLESLAAAIVGPTSHSHHVECDVGAVTLELDPLMTCLWKLVENAVTHHPRQGGSVTITGRIVEGTTLELSVTDDGQGIDIRDRRRIFEPFVSLDGRMRGTGLGLTVARRIAAGRGARISVRSAQGKGCTFTIHWPLRSP